MEPLMQRRKHIQVVVAPLWIGALNPSLTRDKCKIPGTGSLMALASVRASWTEGVSPFYPGWKHCWTSEGNTVPPNRGGSHWHHILHPGARQLFFFTGTGDSEPTQLSFLPEEHTDRTLPETSLLRIQCPIFSPSVLKEIGPGGIFFFICVTFFILFPLE